MKVEGGRMKVEGGRKAVEPLKTDAPFYTEEELDTLYERDPVAALRISREQHRLQQLIDQTRRSDSNVPMPGADEMKAVLEEVRKVLLRDGGDVELIEIADTVVRVRMKGNCAGCPRSALDLKHVVERLIRSRFPAVTRVENVF
jgi:Fe-S cluster biogenesis protein NfuA